LDGWEIGYAQESGRTQGRRAEEEGHGLAPITETNYAHVPIMKILTLKILTK
jgi:hypothetical protein